MSGAITLADFNQLVRWLLLHDIGLCRFCNEIMVFDKEAVV